jgi:hypothetical protein
LIVYWKALSRSSAMAWHPGATPGISVIERSSRVFSTCLLRCSILPPTLQQECTVDGVDDAHAVDDVEGGGDRLPLTRPGGVYGGVAQQHALGDLDKVDRTDDPARAADRADRPEHARSVPVAAARDRASQQ